MSCPLCGSENCTDSRKEPFYHLFQCSTYNTSFYLSTAFLEDFIFNKTDFSKCMNLIVERLLWQPTAKDDASWVFYYNENETSKNENPTYVNLAVLLQNYPKGIIETSDRALMNLGYQHPEYGRKFIPTFWDDLGDLDYRLFFPSSDKPKKDAFGILRILNELGHVSKDDKSYYISARGWQHIEELKRRHAETKQAFIAMSFSPEVQYIRDAFKAAITLAGYAPMVIDEKEHNHQIVPETLLEIERSRFLVLDVTMPNYGAYYEAGYALGLGKEVIICCKQDVFDDEEGKYLRPHFDIAQTSQIRWKDEADLIDRLVKRINATVDKAY